METPTRPYSHTPLLSGSRPDLRGGPTTDNALSYAPGVETHGWSSTKSASADSQVAPAACGETLELCPHLPPTG